MTKNDVFNHLQSLSFGDHEEIRVVPKGEDSVFWRVLIDTDGIAYFRHGGEHEILDDWQPEDILGFLEEKYDYFGDWCLCIL